MIPDIFSCFALLTGLFAGKSRENDKLETYT